MDDTALIDAAALYMQCRPLPYTMLPARTVAGVTRRDGYPAPHTMAPLVAAHCPLAVALIVQHLAARGYTPDYCPRPQPFAIAHLHRQQYAGALLGYVGYHTSAGATWPANTAAMLECWLAVGDNMARAIQYLGDDLTGPLADAPAILSSVLYSIVAYVDDDYDECDLVTVTEWPRAV